MLRLKSFFQKITEQPLVRNTVLGLLALAPVCSNAQDNSEQEKKVLLNWALTGVDLLYTPKDFAFEEDRHLTASLWHANDWKFGDTYAFFEVYDNGGFYGEISPRVSLGKVLNQDVSLGPITDFSLAGNIEIPKDFPARFLIGIGTDIKFKGFDFLKQNFYMRDDPALSGVTWQATTEYGGKLALGKSLIIFDGFIDVAGAEEGSALNVVTQPRFLLDLGHYFNDIGSGKIFVGSEMQLWINKFGVKGENEFRPQLVVVAQF